MTCLSFILLLEWCVVNWNLLLFVVNVLGKMIFMSKMDVDDD